VLNKPSENVWCAASITYSTELAQYAGKEKREQTFEQIISEEY